MATEHNNLEGTGERARHSQVCSIKIHDIYICHSTYVTFALSPLARALLSDSYNA